MRRGAKARYNEKQQGKGRPIAPETSGDTFEPVAANDAGAEKRGGSSPSQPIAKSTASQGSESQLGEHGSPPTASPPLWPPQDRRGGMDVRDEMDGRGGMDGREQRIREIAYFLWQEEGFPDGRSEEHWAAAEAVVDAQDAEPKKGEEDKAGEPRAS